MNDTKRTRLDDILDVAEAGFRRGGFDALSFRDIASEVGIKSASVHYHFPTKDALGQAVVERYTERFLAALGPPNDPSEGWRDRIARLIEVFLAAAKEATCLCAVFAAAAPILPEATADAVRRFYVRALAWIGTSIEDAPANGPIPSDILAQLQGAMIVEQATGQSGVLRSAGDQILRNWPQYPPSNMPA